MKKQFEVEDTKPVFESIQRSFAQINEQNITYNQAGLTYNEGTVAYGGYYEP